ncbi:MAG: TonB-dependent receptor plug domain-containing protein [Agriterribacter sp.]
MRKVYFLLCAILLALTSYAQDTQVSGTVKDERNEPVNGASVKIKGTTRGTYTNEKGFFSMTVPANATLEITSVGFTKQEIKVKGQTSFSVSLATSTSSMEDVVVIGYQKVTRKKTTAAISSMSGKEIENLPAASFDQLMQGRLSGVNVQNFSGDPGASPTVTVRGNTRIGTSWDENTVVNSPLYVVDGVPQSNEKYVTPGAGTGMNYLGGVNPNDIESIDVLKDASAAAIYGSRAANGVILITTKKGRMGAPKVLFSGFAGVTERPKLREVTLGTTERRQKMAILQAQLTQAQQQQLPYLLTDSLNPAFNGHTDWQDLFYQTGIIKSADLSLSGGGEGGTNYRFSTGYYDEQGILKATGTKRYSVRLNLASKALHGKLDINPVIYFTRSDLDRGGAGRDPRYENTNYNPFSLGPATCHPPCLG